MGTENLNYIFKPRRIAVIGASDRDSSLGAKLIQNLIGVGYKGVVYPVNPFIPTVQGITAYPSISKIPWKVDLAIIVTPAHTVPQIVEECGKAGVSGIIIISAGFREAGKKGVLLEKQILEHKNRYNMRIIGPNSFGVMRPKIRLNATFADKTADPGKIAFISQSAALCASALDWASEANVGFSAVVSTGLMLDVDLGDLIDYFGTDAQTRSIVLYVESVKDPRKFMSAARGFARAKPIVLVKAGRFHESAIPTFCHVGAVCGEDAIYDAAFRRVGVVRVEALSDLFSCAASLAMQPNPKGPNLTIITNAGGPGIMATDSLIAKGGKLSPLNTEIVQTLKNFLPSYCSTGNPIDILEEATPDRFEKVIKICIKDPNSNGFLIIYTPQGATNPSTIAKIVVELSKQTKKPILTSLMGEDYRCRRARQVLQKNGIPTFTTPEQAISTFMYMFSYTQNLELLYQTPEELSVKVNIPAFLNEVLRGAFSDGRQVLNLLESLQFLEAYGIPTINTLIARTASEAEAITSELKCPVAMKVLSPQIIHKSKAEGVILNVRSPLAARTIFNEIAERIQNCNPEAESQGIIIQPMVQKRYELLVGSKKDPQFGSVIVFGMGGVATELLKDISIGFPPLNQVLARRLVERTAIYKYATSSEHPINVKLLEEFLVKFSQLVIDFPEIKEIDINPLMIDECSAVAVDARIVIDPDRISKKSQPYEHLVIAPYPKKYISQWKLKNETPVVLRPIKSEDEAIFSELFKSLSEESMHYRFFQIIKEMQHETLTRYCNLDYDREIAIVVELQKEERKIIGAVRLIFDPDGRCGEFAVVVGDQWQGLGLGSKLTDYIIKVAKDMKLDEIYGFIISTNYKMIRLCNKKGFNTKPLDEETIKATLKLS